MSALIGAATEKLKAWTFPLTARAPTSPGKRKAQTVICSAAINAFPDSMERLAKNKVPTPDTPANTDAINVFVLRFLELVMGTLERDDSLTEPSNGQ